MAEHQCTKARTRSSILADYFSPFRPNLQNLFKGKKGMIHLQFPNFKFQNRPISTSKVHKYPINKNSREHTNEEYQLSMIQTTLQQPLSKISVKKKIIRGRTDLNLKGKGK